MGKAEFFGYVGDFVDSKKITGILLLKGDKATDEQKHVVAITAQTQHIDTARKNPALHHSSRPCPIRCSRPRW